MILVCDLEFFLGFDLVHLFHSEGSNQLSKFVNLDWRVVREFGMSLLVENTRQNEFGILLLTDSHVQEKRLVIMK
jgi:hypothetical protein